MPPPPVPMVKKSEKAKSAVVVFRDDGADNDDRSPTLPSTPKFVPFRDEEVYLTISYIFQDLCSNVSMFQPATPSTSTSVVSGTIMKPKAIGPRRDGLGLTEAEALRKDPFKNYGADEKPLED